MIRKFFTILSLLSTPTWGAEELKFTMLDVGQGDGLLVECPKGEVMIVDLGSRKSGQDFVDKIRDQIHPVLKRRWDEKKSGTGLYLDALILTHPDEDHYNLVKPVLTQDNSDQETKLYVDKVLYSGDSHHYGNLERWLNENGNRSFLDKARNAAKQRAIFTGDLLPCKGVKQALIAMESKVSDPRRCGDQGKSNDCSIVTYLEYEGRSIYLMADATGRLEKDILKRWKKDNRHLKLDTDNASLKVGHHGSDSSTSNEWLNFVKPKVALISSDLKENWKHPNCNVIDRIETRMKSYKDKLIPVDEGDILQTCYDSSEGGFVNRDDTTYPVATTMIDHEENIGSYYQLRFKDNGETALCYPDPSQAEPACKKRRRK